MNYRWMLFCLAAALLGAGAWYFGRPIKPRIEPRVDQVRAAEPSKTEPAPKEETPKVIDVIDLARAYEPVCDVEPMTPSEIQAASFIEAQYAPPRIPYAVDEDNEFRDLLIRIRETPLGAFLPRVAPSERIDVVPREIIHQVPNGLLNFVPSEPQQIGPNQLIFTPMSVPFATGIEQPIPTNASIVNSPVDFSPIELLKVMPRELK